MARSSKAKLTADRLRSIILTIGADAKLRAAALRSAQSARGRSIVRPDRQPSIDSEPFAELLAELLQISGESRPHPLGGEPHARRVFSNAIRIAHAHRLDPDDTAALLLAAAASETGRLGLSRDGMTIDHVDIGAAALEQLAPSLAWLLPGYIIEIAVAAVAAHEDDGGAKAGEVVEHLRWAERLDEIGAHGLLRSVALSVIDGAGNPNVISPDRAASPAALWWRTTRSITKESGGYAEEQAYALREWGLELVRSTRLLEPVAPSEEQIETLLNKIESLDPGARTREGIKLLFARAHRRAAAGWFALISGATDEALLGGQRRSRALTGIAKRGEPLVGAGAQVLLGEASR